MVFSFIAIMCPHSQQSKESSCLLKGTGENNETGATLTLPYASLTWDVSGNMNGISHFPNKLIQLYGFDAVDGFCLEGRSCVMDGSERIEESC